MTSKPWKVEVGGIGHVEFLLNFIYKKFVRSVADGGSVALIDQLEIGQGPGSWAVLLLSLSPGPVLQREPEVCLVVELYGDNHANYLVPARLAVVVVHLV